MSSTSNPKSVKIKVKATHYNYLNKNFLLYTENAINKGAKTWIKPYNKPQLVGHNKDGDPIGRIIGYELKHEDKTFDGPKDYVELTINILDPLAIEKVLDGRYSTVSVGSRTERVICSECDKVMNTDGLCEHKKGSINENGKPIYWIIDQIEYIEDSFVNEPADEYTAISHIDIGKGWTPYAQFMDSRENTISLEDNIMDNNDAVLKTATRNALPDSSFCYIAKDANGNKIRKFPCHDAAHARNALARLPQAKLPENVKSRILTCIKRKAARFGVAASDQVEDLTVDIGAEYTVEESAAIDQFFAENPDFDEIQDETPAKVEEKKPDQPTETQDDVSKMKKDELVDLVTKLQTSLKTLKDEKETIVTDNVKKITELETEVKKLGSVITNNEDEINKLIDKNTIIEQKVRNCVISNIIDLKMTDNNKVKREDLESALKTRKIESLTDTLDDLRNSMLSKTMRIDDKVSDPTVTLEDSNKDSDKTVQNKNGEEKFKIFSRPRS